MKVALRNTLVALLIAAGMIASFYYLERAFRKGDGERAIHAVQKLRTTTSAPTLNEELVAQYGPQARFTWISKTADNFRGLIAVSCAMPDGKIRHWRVDLIHGTVQEEAPSQ